MSKTFPTIRVRCPECAHMNILTMDAGAEGFEVNCGHCLRPLGRLEGGLWRQFDQAMDFEPSQHDINQAH